MVPRLTCPLKSYKPDLPSIDEEDVVGGIACDVFGSGRSPKKSLFDREQKEVERRLDQEKYLLRAFSLAGGNETDRHFMAGCQEIDCKKKEKLTSLLDFAKQQVGDEQRQLFRTKVHQLATWLQFIHGKGGQGDNASEIADCLLKAPFIQQVLLGYSTPQPLVNEKDKKRLDTLFEKICDALQFLSLIEIYQPAQMYLKKSSDLPKEYDIWIKIPLTILRLMKQLKVSQDIYLLIEDIYLKKSAEQRPETQIIAMSWALSKMLTAGPNCREMSHEQIIKILDDCLLEKKPNLLDVFCRVFQVESSKIFFNHLVKMVVHGLAQGDFSFLSRLAIYHVDDNGEISLPVSFVPVIKQ